MLLMCIFEALVAHPIRGATRAYPRAQAANSNKLTSSHASHDSLVHGGLPPKHERSPPQPDPSSIHTTMNRSTSAGKPVRTSLPASAPAPSPLPLSTAANPSPSPPRRFALRRSSPQALQRKGALRQHRQAQKHACAKRRQKAHDQLERARATTRKPWYSIPLPPSSRARLTSHKDDKTQQAKSPNPVVTQLDEKDISTFATGRPLQDEPDYKVCKYCKKPVIKTVAAEHVRACLKVKAERLKERKKQKEAAAAAAGKGKEDGGGAAAAAAAAVAAEEEGGVTPEVKKKGPGAKKMAKKEADPGGAKGKKRKADAAAKLPKEPKAKKKKEKQAKPEPKPKAPVDVEKQCGVHLPNGAKCARSLTCKSHSMGAKRSVMGRSQPYDVLLAAYQKKNQAKQQSRFLRWRWGRDCGF